MFFASFFSFCANTFVVSSVFFSTDLYPFTCIFCLSCALFFYPSLLFPTSHLAPLPALSLAGSHTFPLLLKKGKGRQMIPNNVLVTPSVHFRAEWDKERARGNDTSACVRSLHGSQAIMVVKTVLQSFLQLLSLLCLTIFWWSSQFSCFCVERVLECDFCLGMQSAASI